MPNKNFVVKNGLEFSNGSSNIVLTQNSTQLYITVGNSTTNSMIRDYLIDTKSTNRYGGLMSDMISLWGNSTSPSTPNLNITTQNVAFANSTVASSYGRDRLNVGANVTANTTMISAATINAAAITATQNVSVGANITVNTIALSVGNSTTNNIFRSNSMIISGNSASVSLLVANSTARCGFTLTNSQEAYAQVVDIANSVDAILYPSILNFNAGSAEYGIDSMKLVGDTKFITVGNTTVNSSINSSSFSASSTALNISLNQSTGLIIGSSAVPGTSNVIGAVCRENGTIHASCNSTSVPMQVNKHGAGHLIHLREDATLAGVISVSSGLVTYGTFNGSHWSQLKSGKKPNILRGTVVEALNEMCEWPGETNYQLPKFKISDTKKSKNVYGVFFSWDSPEESPKSNDALISSLGAYMIRIAKGTKVKQGDLLQSAGDGTAETQEDDIIRSSTIGKVTCDTIVETYKDGSYLVPCVLYCG